MRGLARSVYSKSIATLCISKAAAATLQRILPPIYLLEFCKAQRFEPESFYYRYYCREQHLLLFSETLENMIRSTLVTRP